MNKYYSAMEKITVTPKMEKRILANLSSKKETRDKSIPKPCFKWIRYAGACATCAVILCVLLLNSSIVNLNWGNQHIQTSKSSDNSGGTGTQSEGLKGQVPKSSDNSGGTGVQTGGLKDTPKSSDNSGGTGTQSGGLKGQVPKSSDNSGGTGAQSEGLKGQVPKSTDNSGETGAQSGEQKDQVPGLPDNLGGTDTQVGDSPIINIKGIEELKKAVPFELFIPEKLPSGYKIDDISVISGELAQIIYSDGNNEIIYRTAKKTDDISGDYTSYEESDIVKVDDTEVTFEGSKSLINLAIWIMGDNSYSLSFSSGIEKDKVVSIIESMKKA